MSGFVYILYSKELDKYYIGSTKDFDQRIKYHREKEFKSSYTTQTDDWILYHLIETENIFVARKIENHIKRMKSREYIENLKKYPKITQKLIKRY
jgi:putative endonuclease